MSMKKNYAMKAVSVAVLSALSGFAAAAVDISGSTVTPVSLAKEISASSSSVATIIPNGGNTDLVSGAGYSFGGSEVKYARFECSSNMKFTSNSVVSSSNSNVYTVGAVNVNNNVAYFTVTANGNAANAALSANSAQANFAVAGNVTVSSTDDVTCAFALYDTASQASNGGDTGKISSSAKSGKYLAFASGITTTVTGATATADVGASPAYTKFTSSANTALLTTVVIADNKVLQANTPAGNVMDSNALQGNTTFTLTGDFTAAASANAAYDTAAKGRVYLSSSSDCNTANNASGATTTALSATSATFTVAAANVASTHYVCFTSSTLTEIPASTYTLAITHNSATGYGISNSTGLAGGEIKRNGSTMVAPLIQTPSGWISRLVLTNHGSSDRTYTVRAVSESGVTTTLTGALSGTQTLPANKTVVVDLTTTFAAAGGAPRGTLVVTANAPSTTVDGLYQIVNATSGTISNHVLSYK